MFKNILVASDGSKCGDKAVDLAIDLASKYGARIAALYVMDFNSELNSLACHNSPLTRDEMETLNKRFKSINSLLNKVAKREAKKRKK